MRSSSPPSLDLFLKQNNCSYRDVQGFLSSHLGSAAMEGVRELVNGFRKSEVPAF